MFCTKCGKPVEGQQVLCDECAAAQAPAAPVEGPIPADDAFALNAPAADTFAQDAPAEEAIVLNTPDAAPVYKAPKKKKNGGLIALIAALVVVAAVAVGFFLFKDSVGNFVDRTFQSPEDYLQTVESNAIEEFSAELTKGYADALATYDTGKTAAATDIRLKLGSELLSMAETALQQQGTAMDLDWLSEIKLSVSTNVQDNAMQVGMGVGLGNTDLLSLDTIFDTASGMFYMAIPELSQEYLGVNIGAELPLNNFGDMLNTSSEAMNDLMKDLPSEREMNKLLNTYAGIILSGIDDVEKETDTVSVGEASQKMVVLTAKIKEKDLIDIAEELLEEAQKDKTLKKVLNAYSDYMNTLGSLNGYYYEPMDLYQEFVDSIPELLEDLDEARDYADSGNYLKLHVYVDMQGKVRGHELAIFAEGKKSGETISWLTAVKGDITYIDAKLGSVEITGEMEETKDASKGEIDLEVEGRELCTLEFENLTGNSGTLRFVPSDEMMDDLLSGSSIPASLLSGNVALELVYDIQGTEVSYEINVLAGSKTFVGLTLSTKASNGGKISMPGSWVDPNNQEAVMQWLQNADLNALVSAMEKADLPQELVDMVKGYIDMLQYYLG